MDLKKTDIKDIKLPNRKQKKAVRFLTKKGINLAVHTDVNNRRMVLIIGIVAILIVAGAAAKFGVIDPYKRLDEAKAKYNETHTEYEVVQQALEGYDEVLLEYRTYSMDWMENDESGKYVSVARREVLDMIEDKMMSKGEVVGIDISGDYAEVEMYGLDLNKISKMCADIETCDFVESAVLETASTEGDGDTEKLSFLISIHRQASVTDSAEAADSAEVEG